jgi:hypothetical protein
MLLFQFLDAWKYDEFCRAIPKKIPKKVCIQKAQFCSWAEYLFFLISEQALIHTPRGLSIDRRQNDVAVFT